MTHVGDRFRRMGPLFLCIATTMLAGCKSGPRAVMITEFERGSLFDLERITYDDMADEDFASVAGEMVVYSTNKDGQSEIYVKPIVGREVTRKTSAASYDTSPSLDAGCTRIAFDSNREGTENIYVMDAMRASAVLRIGPGSSGRFSRDGKSLFYQRYLTGENQTSIWRFDFETSQHSQLVTGFHPAPARTGDRLAYCKFNAGTGFASIWVLDLKTGSESEVASLPDASAILPVWSPDDRYLLFTSNKGGIGRSRVKKGTPNFIVAELAVVKADGTGLTMLTDNPANDIGRDWGADGFIYFQSYREKSVDIWRFRPRLVGQ